MNGVRVKKNILEINTNVNDVEFYNHEDGMLIRVSARPDKDYTDEILKMIRNRMDNDDDGDAVEDATECAKQYSTPNLMSFKEFLKNNKF